MEYPNSSAFLTICLEQFIKVEEKKTILFRQGWRNFIYVIVILTIVNISFMINNYNNNDNNSMKYLENNTNVS